MNTLKDIKIEELISENKKLSIEIEDLKIQVDEEISVKDSEVLMNAQLKEEKEHREIAIEYLQKLNKDLMYKLAVLRIKIKNLSV
jgi:hypothetical protein|tara:strand:+ start:3062 stop:3316 length:255 start_codon:yes stop_codon:yes gene_type:complete